MIIEDDSLAEIYADSVTLWTPPEDIAPDEWADKYRRLDGGLSAEAGQWKTSRTEYMREPMRAVKDPNVEEIVVVSPSQVGKSELELNCIGYFIDQDPGTILYVHPSKEDARDFSTQRLDPLLKNTPKLAEKVRDNKQKGRRATETKLLKTFPGGLINLVGSNSASGLSSKPIRYLIGDELDRWAASAGRDGDPWELAKKRQTTFFNRKRIAVSTPTVKGASQIEFLYSQGTMERWHTECPHCHEFSEIKFRDIDYSATQTKVGQRILWSVDLHGWKCPHCGQIVTEREAKRAPSKWVAENPDAVRTNRTRSFWLNGFVSPWSSWAEICRNYCKVKHDPDRLRAFTNTTLGELWEIRNEAADENELIARAEEWDDTCDLPGEPGTDDAPALLTMGVDCQHNYMQYEIVGWNRREESWGIYTGFIPGSPDDERTWDQLDAITSRIFRFKNGRGLRISLTFIDSGDGHYTNEIARHTAARQARSVFAVKGDGRQGKPFINPPAKIPIDSDKRTKYWLYTLGVNAGKSAIMNAVKVSTPGLPNYMHLPTGKNRGYNFKWYNGLLSEVEIVDGKHIRWVVLPGHKRNEALDCRNYARAALKAIPTIDWDGLSAALRGKPAAPRTIKAKTPQRPMRKSRLSQMLD